MIDVLRQYISAAGSKPEKVHMVREYLQLLILKLMFEQGWFEQLAFTGGTALRILHGTRRFSEDLDFSRVAGNKRIFRDIPGRLAKGLQNYGLTVEHSANSKGNVAKAMVRFPGLLKELDLSPLAGQKIFIKLEADLNPPAGWKSEVVPVSQPFIMAVTTFDLPSSFALKLHACFYRNYVKGRDFYDLVWYLGKKVQPNIKLLNNAVRQTEGKDPGFNNKERLRGVVLKKLSGINFADVRHDVERFLEDRAELKLLDKDMLISMVRAVF